MKRHAFDPFSFLAGLFFVTVAVVALTGGISVDLSFDIAWVLPALLIGAGVAMLVSIAGSRRRAEAARADLAAATAPTPSTETGSDPWLDDDVAATVEEVEEARTANTPASETDTQRLATNPDRGE